MKENMLKKSEHVRSILPCDADIISSVSFQAQLVQIIREFEGDVEGIRGKEGFVTANPECEIAYSDIDGVPGFRIEIKFTGLYEFQELPSLNEELIVEFDSKDEPILKYDFYGDGSKTAHTGRKHILQSIKSWLNGFMDQIKDVVSTVDWNASRKMVYA